VYTPPAYLSSPRALLPVLVLIIGQPGNPRDWLDAGRLVATMDGFAAAHQGLAPVVVVPDPLGSRLAQTLCVDSPQGRAFTYLTVDVPAWIRTHLQIDADVAHWAIGGASAGGTCALQLAVNAPSVYPTFLDLSGQQAPTVGSEQQTLRDFFGGNPAAYRSVNPLDVLASGRVPAGAIAGAVVVGVRDSQYGPDARRVHAALLAAGMDVRYLELPGGHSWEVWAEALRQLLPFLAVRGGLVAQ
jgi:enterochelin esterase-like enzyme